DQPNQASLHIFQTNPTWVIAAVKRGMPVSGLVQYRLASRLVTNVNLQYIDACAVAPTNSIRSLSPMSFPEHVYTQGGDYLGSYRDALIEAWQSVDVHAASRAAKLLETAVVGGRTVFSCGNGGSAAIANHLLCDFIKGVQTDTALRPRVISLASHLELITAIANDIAYDEIFVYQL